MHKDSFKISWILKTSSPFYATFEGKKSELLDPRHYSPYM